MGRRGRPALAGRLPIVVLGVMAIAVGVGVQSVAARTPSAPLQADATAADVTVLALTDLQAEITAAQSDGQQRTVIAAVALDLSKSADHQSPQCLRAEDCPTVVGEITGVPGIPVWASPEVAAFMAGSPSAQASGLLGLTFGNDNVITLLGPVVPHDPGTVLWPATGSGVAPAMQSALQSVIAVHGWLSWTGPLPCPQPASPTPPPNTPFVTCPGAWVTADQYQPVRARTVTPPPDGIRVQSEAYNGFAPENAGQVPAPPVEGTWLLQLVEDPRPHQDPQRGWQLVGELSDTTTGTVTETAIPSSGTQP
jgi:hypothetical protein